MARQGYFSITLKENTVLRIIAMLGIAASVGSCAVAPGNGDGYPQPYDSAYGYSCEYPYGYAYGPLCAPTYGTVNIWGGWGGWGGYRHWHGYEHWHGGGHGGHGGHGGGFGGGGFGGGGHGGGGHGG